MIVLRRLDRNLISAAITWVVIIYVLTVLGGCGGGTSGTGLGTEQATFVGSVLTPDGEPLASVRIENQATGDSTLTTEQGRFILSTERTEGEVPFRIDTPSFSSEFIVDAVPADVPQVSVNLTVDETLHTVAVDRFTVEAGIVGACNSYFENSHVIRQANRVPAGQVCTARITVLGDGKARGHIPVVVQRSACVPNSPWITIAEGETFSGVHQGVAQLAFPFEDSETSCRYRIVAPFDYKEYTPVVYEVQTFTSQEYDRNNPASVETPEMLFLGHN